MVVKYIGKVENAACLMLARMKRKRFLAQKDARNSPQQLEILDLVTLTARKQKLYKRFQPGNMRVRLLLRNVQVNVLNLLVNAASEPITEEFHHTTFPKGTVVTARPLPT